MQSEPAPPDPPAVNQASRSRRLERTTGYFLGYKYTQSFKSRVKISYICSHYRSGCKGTMDFRTASMSYNTVRLHTCRKVGVEATVIDVERDMKTVVDKLALAVIANPARLIWEAVRAQFYGDGNDNVVRGLSGYQVLSHVYRARSLHYTGDVHGSIELPLLTLAQNESISFFQFHFVTSNRADVNKPTRIIGWAHPAPMNLLRYSGTTVFIDGTFRCVRKFKQCVFLMVHDQASGYFVPVFYISSTSKTSDAYWDMIHFVVQATDQNSNPAQVVCDFEPALINAVQMQMPNAEVIGCLFHFKQAIRRSMKCLHISEDEASVAIIPGLLDMLTVIEPRKVTNQGIAWVTAEIKKRCKESGYRYSKLKWQGFWRYFRKIWIERYSPEVWNIHGITNAIVARTNNPFEPFNREINMRFATPHPSMAIFLWV